jgi:hypothetical protein
MSFRVPSESFVLYLSLLRIAALPAIPAKSPTAHRITHIRQRVVPRMLAMQEGPLRAAGAPDQADSDPEITCIRMDAGPGRPACPRARPRQSGSAVRRHSGRDRRASYRANTVGSDGHFVGFEPLTWQLHRDHPPPVRPPSSATATPRPR